MILGGIYGGIFTPTEAAGIACVYAILVARYIYRELTWRQIWQTAVNSGVLISQILIIVAAAGAYSWLITISGFPQKLVELDRKSTRLNSSHIQKSRMPSSA